MIDFFLGIFSEMFQMNMRDHHDMPFAMPLMMACLVGGLGQCHIKLSFLLGYLFNINIKNFVRRILCQQHLLI
jgi:hypothetical protein